MPRLEDKRNAPKISYAASAPDWQWYVGAGLYVDEVDRLIADQRRSLEHQLQHAIVKIMLIMISILIMVSVAARFLSSKIEKGLQALTVFFNKAAGESIRIEPEKLVFTEFASLAESANAMIDQRARVERALRDNREQLQALINNALLGIYRVTAEGKLLFANPRMAKILGYETPEELIADVPDISRIYVDPEDRLHIVQELFDKGTVADRRNRFRRKDGQVIWIQFSARTVEERSGQHVIEGFILDITEQVAFESALKESEERYHSLVEMSPEAVLLHIKGTIVYINRRGARLLGADDPRQIMGKSLLDIIHPDYRETVQKRLVDV